MSLILSATEEERKDMIPAGDDILLADPKHPLGTFNSSFLLFRFANLDEAELNRWKDGVGRRGLKTVDEFALPSSYIDYNHNVKLGNENKPGFLQM